MRTVREISGGATTRRRHRHGNQSDGESGGAPFRRRSGEPWGSGVVDLIRSLGRRPVPQLWPWLLGAVATASVLVLLVTGVILTVFYTPSNAVVRYDGPYPLLRGVEMSEAYASIIRISFEVPAGLLVRQAHHWAALLLPAALLLRLLYAFFTGEFRRPRRLAWVALFGLFIAALAGGWSGYALPDDLLAGTGLRIFHGVLLGIPVIGTPLSVLIFGGGFPGDVLSRLYPIHVAIVPAGLVLLGLVRLRLGLRSRPPQFHRAGRTEDNVVGPRLWPTVAVKSFGMFMITAGLLVVMAGTAEIGPAWRQGPSSPAAAGAGSQPDWYTAFLDGALRLVPPGWEVNAFGQTWTFAVLVPLAGISLFFIAIAGFPLIEQWLTGDRDAHHLLDRPRDVPVRTGLGVAGLVFYGTLWAAGSADLIATQFQLSFNVVILAFQATVLVGPLIGFVLARAACLELQRREHDELTHGVENGVLVRLPSGGYVEGHSPLPPRRRHVPASLEEVPTRSVPQRPSRFAVGRVGAHVSRRYLAGARRPTRLEPVARPLSASRDVRATRRRSRR